MKQTKKKTENKKRRKEVKTQKSKLPHDKAKTMDPVLATSHRSICMSLGQELEPMLRKFDSKMECVNSSATSNVLVQVQAPVHGMKEYFWMFDVILAISRDVCSITIHECDVTVFKH